MWHSGQNLENGGTRLPIRHEGVKAWGSKNRCDKNTCKKKRLKYVLKFYWVLYVHSIVNTILRTNGWSNKQTCTSDNHNLNIGGPIFNLSFCWCFTINFLINTILRVQVWWIEDWEQEKQATQHPSYALSMCVDSIGLQIKFWIADQPPGNLTSQTEIRNKSSGYHLENIQLMRGIQFWHSMDYCTELARTPSGWHVMWQPKVIY